jgi:hypothetical protein
MKAFVHKGRIRVVPKPKEEGYMLWVMLKTPLTKANKPFVYADIEPGRKFYDLPCPVENILAIAVRTK